MRDYCFLHHVRTQKYFIRVFKVLVSYGKLTGKFSMLFINTNCSESMALIVIALFNTSVESARHAMLTQNKIPISEYT